MATDIALQRNFKIEQKYLVVGHNTMVIFHLSQQHAVFSSFSYYGNGKYSNNVTATAKSPLTLPQEQSYINSGRMRAKEFTLGWRRYLIGDFERNDRFNLYGSAAFGLMLGRVNNSHNIFIDSNNYHLPVQPGLARFKRLTVDLALGAEHAVGGDFYFYMEARAWIPTTDYPSKHLFVNDNAPFMGMLGAGFRLLF